MFSIVTNLLFDAASALGVLVLGGRQVRRLFSDARHHATHGVIPATTSSDRLQVQCHQYNYTQSILSL